MNEKPIFKGYKNFLKTTKEDSEITSIGFFDIRNEKSLLLAVGWYGISTKVNEVIDKINPERGIRIKKNNITIGNEQTLFPRFKADRTNLRYIGEIHTVGDRFIPNARRDYFNDNNTIEEFQESLESIFSDFESKLPHRASDLHNRLKNVVTFKKLVKTYRSDSSSFKTSSEQEQRLKEVFDSLKVAENAEKKLNKIKTESDNNPQLRDLFNSIIGKHDYSIDHDELSDLYSQKIYPPLEFSKVSKQQEDILNEVVIFLQKELGYKVADAIIKKLQTKYN